MFSLSSISQKSWRKFSKFIMLRLLEIVFARQTLERRHFYLTLPPPLVKLSLSRFVTVTPKLREIITSLSGSVFFLNLFSLSRMGEENIYWKVKLFPY